MPMRVCAKCGKELPATGEWFEKQKNGKYGLRSVCRCCRVEARKENYKKNKELCQKNYQSNKKTRLEYGNRYYKENSERMLAYGKQYYDKCKETISERHKKYKSENFENRRMYKQTRKSLEKSLPATLTVSQWAATVSKFKHRCAYCGRKSKLTQDHFIPLVKGGGYTCENIVPACGHCNSSKGGKDFLEWYPKQESYSKEREDFILEHLSSMAKAGPILKEATQ